MGFMMNANKNLVFNFLRLFLLLLTFYL